MLHVLSVEQGRMQELPAPILGSTILYFANICEKLYQIENNSVSVGGGVLTLSMQIKCLNY